MKPNAFGPQTGSSTPPLPWLIPILGACVLLGSLSAATQYFAHVFDYHATLGRHIGFVYPPWTILEWFDKWGAHYPRHFMQAGNVGVMAAAAGLLCLLGLKTIMARATKTNRFPHGSARWAEKKDIEAAGLMPRKLSVFERISGRSAPAFAGVYVGAWEDKKGRRHYLRHNGPEHVLCYAPTRSGKGVGLIIPTLLSWPDSAVITDLKGELWALTSGWRQKHAHNRVLRFEPAAASGGAHWNPLDEIRLGTEHEVGDVQNLATLIVDPDGKGLETHWQKSAQALLVGVILHALYQASGENSPAPSLYDIDALFSDPDRAAKELWLEMHQIKPESGSNYRLVSSVGRDMLDRPAEERGSVLSTAKSYLLLYRDPVVRANISDSHFHIRDFMNHASPVSLYIVTKPTDKARLRPLIRVMMNMIVRLLADHMDFEDGRYKARYNHRLLMMLDEFPSLGKLEILQESLAFLAGYGIKCYLICQDINQLRSRTAGYGVDESITSNCHIQTAFPPNRIETAEHLSRLAGDTTIAKEQVTEGAKYSLRTTTTHEIQRPLLTLDECLRMQGPVKGLKDGQDVIEEAGDMIVYVAGFPAIYGKQPLYFQDTIFKARAEVPAPIESDMLIQGSGLKTLTCIARILAIGGAGFVVLGMMCFSAGGRFNSTCSIPLGLYWITDSPVRKNAYVIFCPPQSNLFDEARLRGYIGAGFCPGGYGFMMKRILAMGNDRIGTGLEDVRVNGILLPLSARVETDKAGRSMPPYPFEVYTLEDSEMLLMSDGSGTSFDSRYFGPIHTPQIRGVLRPLLTW